MRYLFGREGAKVLERLASARALLAFDFDGTLAPIVERRDEARMRPHTTELFRAVCRLFPCAVISGRGRADAARRLGGATVKQVVGNHGLEPSSGLRAHERTLARARRHLEAALAHEPGIDLEDKRYSLALHYRASPSRRTARAAILRAVAELPVPMRTVKGKLVVNVVPAQAPDKGQALLRLSARLRAEVTLFVGDDVTDEDVFELDAGDRVVSVRVGRSTASSAAYFLREQGEIDRLLARLAELRSPGARRPTRSRGRARDASDARE